MPGSVACFRANVEIPAGQTASDQVPTSKSSTTACRSRSILELDLKNRILYWTDRGDPPRGQHGETGPRSTTSPPSRRSR